MTVLLDHSNWNDDRYTLLIGAAIFFAKQMKVEEGNVMAEFEEVIHRTWVQFLAAHDCKELAAIALDGKVSILSRNNIQNSWIPYKICIDLPPDTYSIIMKSQNYQDIMTRSIQAVSNGHIVDEHGLDYEELPVEFRIRLIKVETGWKEKIKLLISESRESNQGTIAEIVFARKKKQPLLYNEMKFASQSEIAIAHALEEKGVLFFQLPLAVRSDTGALHLDHREPDFLICNDGVWGILEVAYHPNRYEKDSEKDIWFKQSGILCIQNYTAEKCYQNPTEVVSEFLTILARFKRN